VIDAKYFSLSELLLLVLLLFKFLELKMAAKPSHHYNFLVVVYNLWVGLWFERAVF
jgi:hypothetical protein